MGKKSSKKTKERKENRIIPSPKPEFLEEKERLSRKWYLLLLAVIMVVTILSYINSAHNQFVFDDNQLILKNPTIRGVEKIPRLLGMGKWRASYRPVRMISYAVDYTLNKKLWRHVGRYEGWDEGLNPLGYHISNCLYHLLTTLLVFLVVSRLVSNYRIAFLAAALFALHPVNTDSVTYLSGRRDILFALFYLAGFYFFLCYRQTRKITFILAAFLSYLLSLGSKEMGVTLPAIFLCYDLVNNFPQKVRKINLTYFKELFFTFKKVLVESRYLYSLVFMGALFFGYYKVFIKSPSNRIAYYGDSMITTFLTVGKILVYYIKLLVYPINLNVDYSYNAFPLSSSFLEPATLCSFIFLGVVGYAVLRLTVTHRIIAFGVIWFFITLLPVCHIFPHHELLAEHYLYLPAFGFCLVAASLLNEFLKERRYRYCIYTCFAALLLLFSLRIVDRNRDWKDELTLWGKTVKTAPQCARAHNNLGVEYDERGRTGKAVAEYEIALSIKPHFAKPYNNLGFIYYEKGEIDKAVSAYKKALNIKPGYAKAHNNLGAAYLKKGMIKEAMYAFLRALRYKRRFVEAHIGLGVVWVKQGRLDSALYQFKKALEIKSDLPEAHSNLASTYYLQGDYKMAIYHCGKAEELGYKVSPQLLELLRPYR